MAKKFQLAEGLGVRFSTFGRGLFWACLEEKPALPLLGSAHVAILSLDCLPHESSIALPRPLGAPGGTGGGGGAAAAFAWVTPLIQPAQVCLLLSLAEAPAQQESIVADRSFSQASWNIMVFCRRDLKWAKRGWEFGNSGALHCLLLFSANVFTILVCL